jgi:hypothetical protein
MPLCFSFAGARNEPNNRGRLWPLLCLLSYRRVRVPPRYRVNRQDNRRGQTGGQTDARPARETLIGLSRNASSHVSQWPSLALASIEVASVGRRGSVEDSRLKDGKDEAESCRVLPSLGHCFTRETLLLSGKELPHLLDNPFLRWLYSYSHSPLQQLTIDLQSL